MKVIYDPTSDVIQIVFREAIVEDFSEDLPGVKVDYDLEDNMIALEIQNASNLVDDLRSVKYEILDSSQLTTP